MYRYLPDMTPYFTTDGQSTKIHACKWQVLNYSGFFYRQSYFSWELLNMGRETISIELKFEETSVIDTK